MEGVLVRVSKKEYSLPLLRVVLSRLRGSDSTQRRNSESSEQRHGVAKIGSKARTKAAVENLTKEGMHIDA